MGAWLPSGSGPSGSGWDYEFVGPRQGFDREHPGQRKGSWHWERQIGLEPKRGSRHRPKRWATGRRGSKPPAGWLGQRGQRCSAWPCRPTPSRYSRYLEQLQSYSHREGSNREQVILREWLTRCLNKRLELRARPNLRITRKQGNRDETIRLDTEGSKLTLGGVHFVSNGGEHRKGERASSFPDVDEFPDLVLYDLKKRGYVNHTVPLRNQSWRGR